MCVLSAPGPLFHDTPHHHHCHGLVICFPGPSRQEEREREMSRAAGATLRGIFGWYVLVEKLHIRVCPIHMHSLVFCPLFYRILYLSVF